MAIIGLGIAIAFVLAAQSLMQQNVGTGRRNTPPEEETAHSTPAHAWRKGEVPFLYQIDPQWSDEPYAGGNIHENGCGPTCLSMVYISLTGKTDLDPAAMARFSEQNGFTVDGMTAWVLMTDGAAMLGLRGTELSASADVVRVELEAGRPIICSVRPGDFTSTGHFIVLAGLTDDGQVMVRDPNSAGNGDHPWDLDRILGQCANLWSFSAQSRGWAAAASPSARRCRNPICAPSSRTLGVATVTHMRGLRKRATMGSSTPLRHIA